MGATPEYLQQQIDDSDIVTKALELGVPPPADTIGQWHDWLKAHGTFNTKTSGHAVLWEYEFNNGREYPRQKFYTYDEKDEKGQAEVIRMAVEDLYEFRKKT